MRVFGLIGRSLSHSFSQAYFTRKFARLGLDDCRYELFELASAHELPALLARQPHLAGLNVTIPYKEQIWPYLTEVAPSAARVGAVNVLEVRADGRLIGHNT
ncbi:MAG: shikimate dehydrogenase, partial [Hymenobacter sp.]